MVDSQRDRAHPEPAEGNLMHLMDYSFLAAETPRSIVYLEKFASQGIKFGSVILLRNPNKTLDLEVIRIKVKSLNEDTSSLHPPDFKKSLEHLAHQVSDKVTIIETSSIKDDLILQKLRDLKPKFTIYSGFGGQIVPKALLYETRFIHAHAGWLPEYRGSTTIYYSLIDRNDCAVSVIELKPKIDTGDILARKRYSAPIPGVDIDYIYDNQIRADLLSETLGSYSENKEFDMIVSQNEKKSTTYYVIHPLLKHLAILSISNE